MLNKKNAPLIALSIYLFAMTTFSNEVEAQDNQVNARFNELKQLLFERPYEDLPTYMVSRDKFGKTGKGADNILLQDARRTLVDERDLIEFPSGQKLLQANGICFAAIWLIDQVSEFTGLFAQATQSSAIVRASVSLSGTLQKDKRAFGMAIKLLPDNLDSNASLNVFVLNSMGGAVVNHVLDLPMDNEPKLGRIPRWRDISTALRLRKDLEQADRDSGAEQPQVAFRPVSHLASYKKVKNAVTPKWLRLTARESQRINKADFRDELRIEHYASGNIVYAIEVAAGDVKSKSKAQWQQIGKLILQQSVTSEVCDKRLHFKHPKLL